MWKYLFETLCLSVINCLALFEEADDLAKLISDLDFDNKSLFLLKLATLNCGVFAGYFI